ncbi:family 16 glycoside hydrolase [Sphingomonas silueang]|uniref:family 16 glycoside hydrolase n=1 Tax=Sphingomonas silueang TaxID=3156617 RepID=UPI0032B38F39
MATMQRRFVAAMMGLTMLIGSAWAIVSSGGGGGPDGSGIITVSPRSDAAVGQAPASANAAGTTAASGTGYYVDAVAGDDANTGTSAASPWRTLARAGAATLRPGDAILLKAGSVWTGQSLDLRGSGAPGAPIVVDRYGSGARPVIDFADTAIGGEGFGVRVVNGSYWEVRNLEITSGQQPTSRRRNGILFVGTGAGAGAMRHIHIVGNVIHDIFGADRRGGGINLHSRRAAAGDPEPSWDDVLIENNVVDNVADTGIQTMTDAFLVQTGWTRVKTAFSRVLIRRNTVTRIHRDGILVRAAQAPLVEYNTTDMIGRYTTATGATAGYLANVQVVAAQWMYYVDRGVFQYNQASRTRRIAADGQAWDFDVGVNDSVYQYNYSHDNEGGALLVMNGTSGNVFRYNISQNDLDYQGAVDFDNGFTGTIYLHNNVFFRNRGQTGLLAARGGSGAAVTYRNNIFYGDGSFETGAGVTYDANSYFGSRANTVPDANRIIGDPLFMAPGNATSIADAAASYALAPGSASRDTAATITENGGIDFAGRVLPSGGLDRGAIEGDAVAIAANSNQFEAGTLGLWSIIAGDWIVGGTPGALQSRSTSVEGVAITGDAGWTDYSVGGTVAVDTPVGNAGLLLRYANSASFLMARLNDANDRLELLQRSGSGFTTLGSVQHAVEPGTFATLRVDVAGQRITVWLNGQKAIATTLPATAPAAGRIGARTANSKGRIDDVVIRR